LHTRGFIILLSRRSTGQAAAAAKTGSSNDFSINDELIGDILDPQAITVTLHT
jgi:hypothetical protein